ncbi:MAG: hypothetical protein J3Q66DRAFT_81526 [Benniella sp.]|nr:MAG: hypothetical protein J3Q66DRAFT_81526 [Benniella sp.]
MRAWLRGLFAGGRRFGLVVPNAVTLNKPKSSNAIPFLLFLAIICNIFYEESDQLCIEMERQQLGLMQPYTASLNSVVRPDAPPETAILITDGPTPTLSSSIPMTPVTITPTFVAHHRSPLQHPVIHTCTRIPSQWTGMAGMSFGAMCSEKMSSSPSTAFLQAGELLQHSGHHASSSSSHRPYGVQQQQQPESFANQEKNPIWEEDECGPFHCASSTTIIPGNRFAAS